MTTTQQADARLRWGCTCGRLFATKSGRTRHMLCCAEVSERVKDALRP